MWKLSDDEAILTATCCKTPIQVLQEHCHKFVGSLPVYTDRLLGEPHTDEARYEVTAKVQTMSASGVDKIKKKGKQKAALNLLRDLYPKVTSWGNLLDMFKTPNKRITYDAKLRAHEAQRNTAEAHKVEVAEVGVNFQVLNSLKRKMGEKNAKEDQTRHGDRGGRDHHRHQDSDRYRDSRPHDNHQRDHSQYDDRQRDHSQYDNRHDHSQYDNRQRDTSQYDSRQRDHSQYDDRQRDHSQYEDRQRGYSRQPVKNRRL